MGANIGLTGICEMSSNGTVGALGKPIRVFDVAVGASSLTAAVFLYNGVTSASAPYIAVLSSNTWHSNVGIRFKDGCIAYASNGTAVINYITEF